MVHKMSRNVCGRLFDNFIPNGNVPVGKKILFNYDLRALIANFFIFIQFVNGQKESKHYYTPYKDTFDFFVNAIVPFLIISIIYEKKFSFSIPFLGWIDSFILFLSLPIITFIFIVYRAKDLWH